MRPPATVAIVLFIVIAAHSQGPWGHCPNSPVVPGENYADHWFDGDIGTRQARMYLASGGGVVNGAFYFTNDWKPIFLGGTLSKAGLLQISAHVDSAISSAQVGHLTGKLKASELTGTWMPLDGRNKARVRLKAVREPQCGTDSGQWLRFDDPQWPVTLQYPASWRIENDGNNLRLTCPDPEWIAYEGFHISVKHGLHRSDEDFWLKRCGKGWYNTSCDCDDLTGVFCDTPAEVAEKEGMTFIHGGTLEWRGYCIGGGYMGQTEGERQVILIGDQYVEFIGEGMPSELIEEILPTVKLR